MRREWPNRHTMVGMVTCRDMGQLEAITRDWDTIERLANVVMVRVGIRGGLILERDGWEAILDGRDG